MGVAAIGGGVAVALALIVLLVLVWWCRCRGAKSGMGKSRMGMSTSSTAVDAMSASVVQVKMPNKPVGRLHDVPSPKDRLSGKEEDIPTAHI